MAQKLGLSISTVSRALRGMPEINLETREAVLKLSKDLDYNPSTSQSEALISKNLIGVIVPSLDFYFTTAIKGMDEAALQAGFSLLVCLTNESYGREVANMQKLLQSNIHGLILAKATQTQNFDHLKRCENKEIPIVLFERDCVGINAPKILLDNTEGGFLATKHLIEKGYRKIAFVGTGVADVTKNPKLQGFKNALKEIKLDLNEKNLFLGEFDTNKAYEKTKEILKANDRPDAFFASNDQIAIGVMQAIHEFGYNMPKDYGVIGYFDEPTMPFLTPSVSSVAIPAFDMGKQAVNTLIEQILLEDKITNTTTILFKPKLETRESSNLQKRFFGI